MIARVRLASTPEERFAAQIAASAAEIDRLPTEAVRAILALLDETRRSVLAELAGLDSQSFAAFRLAQTQRGLIDVMARFVDQYQAIVTPAQQALWDAGRTLAAEPLVRGGLLFHVPLPSRRLLEVARDYQASLITGLASDAVAEISTALRAAVLRGQSLYEAIPMIAGSLAGPSTFGSLATRAETITRTELGRIQSIANQATLDEAKGFVPDLQKQWQHSGNTGRWRREGHVEADGQIRETAETYRVRPRPDRPYERLQYPRDPAGSAASTINCFLPGTLVRGWFVGALKAGYSGSAREIQTARGQRLRVTPNHPVLTSDGWLAAGLVQEGQHLLGYLRDVRPRRGVDAEDRPAPVEQVFEALSVQGVLRSPHGRLDLHGDAVSVEGDVKVAGTYRELLLDIETPVAQSLRDLGLVTEYAALPSIHRDRLTAFLGRRAAPALGRLVGGSNLASDVGGVLLEALPGDDPSFSRSPEHDTFAREVSCEGDARNAGPARDREQRLAALVGADQPGQVRDPHALGFSKSAELDAVLAEVARQRAIGDAGGLLEIQEAFPALVAADQVTKIRDFEHSGHVYDLQSVQGVLVADGLILSNCGCLSLPYRAAWKGVLEQAA